MPDAWDEGFDTWSGEDAFENIDRSELLRLARELARQRDADRAAAQAEIDGLKQALRERAEQIAARERELQARERAREGDGARRSRFRRRDPDEELDERRAELDDQAYELAQRASAVAERERELARLEEQLERELADAQRRGRGLFRRKAAEPEQQPPAGSVVLDARERELAQRAAALEQREQEGAKRLAENEASLVGHAEALDEREAALRAQADALDARARELEERARERPGPAPGAAAAPGPAEDADGRERELARREAKVAARERELALIRQGLDAERNALLAREREASRRASEGRDALAPPLAPLGFSEGLAAFASNRTRRSTPPRRYR